MTITEKSEKLTPEKVQKILQWAKKLRCEMDDDIELDKKIKALQTFINLTKIYNRHTLQRIKSGQNLIEDKDSKFSGDRN